MAVLRNSWRNRTEREGSLAGLSGWCSLLFSMTAAEFVGQPVSYVSDYFGLFQGVQGVLFFFEWFFSDCFWPSGPVFKWPVSTCFQQFSNKKTFTKNKFPLFILFVDTVLTQKAVFSMYFYLRVPLSSALFVLVRAMPNHLHFWSPDSKHSPPRLPAQKLFRVKFRGSPNSTVHFPLSIIHFTLLIRGKRPVRRTSSLPVTFIDLLMLFVFYSLFVCLVLAMRGQVNPATNIFFVPDSDGWVYYPAVMDDPSWDLRPSLTRRNIRFFLWTRSVN